MNTQKTAALLPTIVGLALLSGPLSAQPAVSVASSSPGLEIRGLYEMMTGWQRVEAVPTASGISRVEWRVNGRPVKSEDPFAANLYFGGTPQPRQLEVVALDDKRSPRFVVQTTINAGGRSVLLEFVEPLSGAPAAGETEVVLCADAPADRPIETIEIDYQRVGTSTPQSFEARRAEAGRCRRGQTWVARVPIVADQAATLTARLRLEPVVAASDLWSPAVLERSVMLNRVPAFSDVIDVRLLEWPVLVSHDQRPVEGLERQSFRLFEDRKECEILSLATSEEAPLRLALVFDWTVSTSLDKPVESRAASEFLRQLFDPDKDAAAIWGIARSPIPYLGWTRRFDAIETALAGLEGEGEIDGGTAIYDSLMRVLYEMQSGGTRGIPAIVLLTDGVDNASVEFDAEDVLSYARRSGVRIYPIAVQVRVDRGLTELDQPFLMELARSSGGRFHLIELDGRARGAREGAAALRRQAEDLRQNPGELAQDPRFLQHLIVERVQEAERLEAQLARQDRHNEGVADELHSVLRSIRSELAGTYVLVARGRAERSDRWHEVDVRLASVDEAHRYRVHAASGVHW